MHFSVLDVIKASSILKLESILCLTVSCVTDNFVRTEQRHLKARTILTCSECDVEYYLNCREMPVATQAGFAAMVVVPG